MVCVDALESTRTSLVRMARLCTHVCQALEAKWGVKTPNNFKGSFYTNTYTADIFFPQVTVCKCIHTRGISGFLRRPSYYSATALGSRTSRTWLQAGCGWPAVSWGTTPGVDVLDSTHILSQRSQQCLLMCTCGMHTQQCATLPGNTLSFLTPILHMYDQHARHQHRQLPRLQYTSFCTSVCIYHAHP